jgi:hypothetical protein
MSRFHVDSVSSWALHWYPIFVVQRRPGFYTQTLKHNYKQPAIRVTYRNNTTNCTADYKFVDGNASF